MTANELRSKYIAFFKSKNHVEISGKSLIPDNDPTVLFTTAGMHPLVPFLLGEPHPAGNRLTDYQNVSEPEILKRLEIPAILPVLKCWVTGLWRLLQKESIAYSYST